MSNLNQFLLKQDEKKTKPTKSTAKIRGRKPIGTTDDDEGRRGLHRHQDEGEDGRLDNFDDEGFREERPAV